MEITPDVIEAFRAFYPEFADADKWPDTTLTRYLREADEETGRRWGPYGDFSLKQRGMFAYVAHRAVLTKAAARATEAGGIASAPAQVTSKSVGDESASFAVSAPANSAEANQLGDLRSTIYGVEFLRLRLRAGMGAVAV